MQLLQESVAFMVPKTAVAAVTAAARGESLTHCLTNCLSVFQLPVFLYVASS
jgi:hypothetical protein